MTLMYAPLSQAETHTVEASVTSFDPMVVQIEPGDTVRWVNMTSHNVNSYGDEQGLIPEGAENFKSTLNQNFSVTLEQEGVYVYVCDPHYSLGMVGAIIVGDPVNLDKVVNKAEGMAQRAADAAKEAVK